MHSQSAPARHLLTGPLSLLRCHTNPGALTCPGEASAVSEGRCFKAGIPSSALLEQVGCPVACQGSEISEPGAGAFYGRSDTALFESHFVMWEGPANGRH